MDNNAKCFVNFSNHPSNRWDFSQKKAALRYGASIVDLSFPEVDPALDESGLDRLAEEKYREILALHPAAVMCQGEFGLTFAVVQRLLSAGITVLHACSERNVLTEGNKKIVRFDFVQFRRFEAVRK